MTTADIIFLMMRRFPAAATATRDLLLDRIIGVQPVYGRAAISRHWERCQPVNDKTD